MDLTGKRFGRLTVLKFWGRFIQPSGQFGTSWLCKCDCGESTVVTHGNLVSGHTQSCGCLRCSTQEAVIKHRLNELHIHHIKEYIFPDFISTTGRAFRFDYALLDENNNLLALLEYQGSQHYIVTPGFESYGAAERNVTDRLKREYCAEHHIPLYEIKYTEDTVQKLDQILMDIYGNTVPSLNHEEGVTTISEEST